MSPSIVGLIRASSRTSGDTHKTASILLVMIYADLFAKGRNVLKQINNAAGVEIYPSYHLRLSHSSRMVVMRCVTSFILAVGLLAKRDEDNNVNARATLSRSLFACKGIVSMVVSNSVSNALPTGLNDSDSIGWICPVASISTCIV
jgi:hypothetical protein